MKLSKGGLVALLVVVLLAIDQVSKIIVKLNMTIGESIPVFGDWFQICFIENNGMAFGMQFGGGVGKVLLTLFRLVLIGFIIYYIKRVLLKKSDTPTGVLVGVSLVLVGAIGNVIDSLFYGQLFSASSYGMVAEFLPEGGGYAPLLMGKVVDMLYFPIIDTTLPEWVPFWGGEHFLFFRPVFNFADSCISVAVFYLIIFQRSYFSRQSSL